MKAVERFNTAFETGDLSTLDEMTTDDYTHTNGSSKAFGKESWFNYLRNRTAELQNGQLAISVYSFTEVETTMYDQSAMVTGVVSVSGTRNGESFSNKLRVTNFWVVRDGNWKRAGFHDTRIE